MTLIMTVVSRAGIWQSSDHRLSARTQPYRDPSIKHVRLDCTDGKALLAYAGIGRVGDTHISDWVRRLLRGKRRSIHEALHTLVECSTARLAPISARANLPHTFAVGAFRDGDPRLYVITNRVGSDNGVVFPAPKFYWHAWDIGPAEKAVIVYLDGSGAHSIKNNDAELLIAEHIEVNWGKAVLKDAIIDNLAFLNRRAARNSKFVQVSPECVISYLAPDGSMNHRWDGAPLFPPMTVLPHVAGEFDIKQIMEIMGPSVKDWMSQAWKAAEKGEKPPDLDREAINAKLAAADWA